MDQVGARNAPNPRRAPHTRPATAHQSGEARPSASLPSCAVARKNNWMSGWSSPACCAPEGSAAVPRTSSVLNNVSTTAFCISFGLAAIVPHPDMRRLQIASVNAGGKTFSATSRSSLVSRARYASPTPPSPIVAVTAYGPSAVPGLRAIASVVAAFYWRPGENRECPIGGAFWTLTPRSKGLAPDLRFWPQTGQCLRGARRGVLGRSGTLRPREGSGYRHPLGVFLKPVTTLHGLAAAAISSARCPPRMPYML